MSDYTKLKELAEAIHGKGTTVEMLNRWAQFEAACKPELILGLIADAAQSEQDYKDVVGTIELRDIEISRLKTENAGLKTGYEAYEQVVQRLKAEVEAITGVLANCREFIMNDAKVRRMTDGTRHILPMFPLRKLVMEQIDAALGKGEKS